jgi:glycosyltransferase involved in cell wall biosynthesis
VKLIYAFPEPLPLARARGIQAAHTVVELAKQGIGVELYHVPAGAHPIRHYGMEPPPNLHVHRVSRSLLPLLDRPHSNRFFVARLLRATSGLPGAPLVMVRHLKLASLLLERAPQARLVYEAHEVFADTAPSDTAKLRQQEEAQVTRQAQAIVCNSAATASRLRNLYGAPRRLEIIPNGVDRPASLPEKDWARAGRHIVYAGSLFPWKGAGDLVAAAAFLEGCRIELVGGEPEQVHELASSTPRFGAEIMLTGQVPHARALERLAEACIAVLPNRPDADSAFTSPIKLFEYMAAGCAVVASDLPPIREILDEDEASWAKPGDPASLAAAIRALASDPARARSLGARVREKSLRYTWKARAEQLKRVLERVERGEP